LQDRKKCGGVEKKRTKGGRGKGPTAKKENMRGKVLGGLVLEKDETNTGLQTESREVNKSGKKNEKNKKRRTHGELKEPPQKGPDSTDTKNRESRDYPVSRKVQLNLKRGGTEKTRRKKNPLDGKNAGSEI